MLIGITGIAYSASIDDEIIGDIGDMNDWDCVTLWDDCIMGGSWVMICGEGDSPEEVNMNQQRMLEELYIMFGC